MESLVGFILQQLNLNFPKIPDRYRKEVKPFGDSYHFLTLCFSASF